MTEKLTARETILVEAISGRLGELYQVPEGKQDAPMEVNGQYRALQTEVENVRSEFHDFKSDVNLRFSEISTALKGIETSIGRAFTGGGGGNSDGSGWTGMLGVAALALTIAGAFGTLVKMNIDTNVADAQERTMTAERHLTEDITTLTSTVRTLQETTIPRPELNYRIDDIREVLREKADKAVVDQVIARLDGQITYLRADIERLKGDIVTRRENESHWADLQNRTNLLADRVNDLAKSTNGASLSDQIKSLQDQVSGLVQKFVVVPH